MWSKPSRFQPSTSSMRQRSRGETDRTCGLIIASRCWVTTPGWSVRRPLTKIVFVGVRTDIAIAELRPSDAVSAERTGPVRAVMAWRTGSDNSAQSVRSMLGPGPSEDVLARHGGRLSDYRACSIVGPGAAERGTGGGAGSVRVVVAGVATAHGR